MGNHEGYMHVSELAHQNDDHKASVGGWNHLKKQVNEDEDSESTAWGSYAYYEKKVGAATWVFARMGWANPQASAIHTNAASGVAYKGIFQRKKSQDEIGFGATRVHFSRLTEATAHETAYERYYNLKPMKILSLRADVQ
jgi:carbohydrate-selective porin OprB